MLDFALQSFVTMFVIIDPIGILPIYIGLMAGAGAKEHRQLALKATLVAFLVLLLFGLIGGHILQAIGIGLPAFRIAGGLLLFLLAIEMLFQKRAERRSKSLEDDLTFDNEEAETMRTGRADRAVFPLAVPLLAGPSAMASVILLTETEPSDWSNRLIVIGVAGSVLFVAFLLFALSHLIARYLNRTTVDLITRILGLLLAALSVQFVLDGLADYGFRTLAGG